MKSMTPESFSLPAQRRPDNDHRNVSLTSFEQHMRANLGANHVVGKEQ